MSAVMALARPIAATRISACWSRRAVFWCRCGTRSPWRWRLFAPVPGCQSRACRRCCCAPRLLHACHPGRARCALIAPGRRLEWRGRRSPPPSNSLPALMGLVPSTSLPGEIALSASRALRCLEGAGIIECHALCYRGSIHLSSLTSFSGLRLQVAWRHQ